MRSSSSTNAIGIASAVLLYSPVATAETPPAPLAGKTVALKIGWPPGSGNSILGRLVAEHLGRHIPGQPKVVPQYMPGASTFVAGNYMYSIAPKDGTVLGYISQTAPTEELVGNPAVQFESAKFSWIGRVASYNMVTTTWHTTPVKTIADAMKYETTAGADAIGSTTYNYPHLLNKTIGTKFKMVLGYSGTAATALAMERGEVDGISTGWFTVKTARSHWLEPRKINILVQYLATRHPDLPDVPSVMEFARTDAERQLLQLYANEGEIGKAILGPPGLPAPLLASLRTAFADMMKDADFLADANRQMVELSPLAGDKLQELISSVAKTPPAVVQQAKAMFK